MKDNLRSDNRTKRISGTTGLIGLIGTPVGHSKSPMMYNYSFQKLGLDLTYLAFDSSIENVSNTINAMKVLNMRGCNVTMPCKTEVVKYLDSLSPAARITGAVNTIVNQNGHLIGHITDGLGFVRNLEEKGIDIKDKKIILLGAGGAATAILVQCALDGAKEVTVFNKKDDYFRKAEKTLVDLQIEVPNCKVNLFDIQDIEKLYGEIADSHILINATLVGMYPNIDETNIKDVHIFRKDLVVADVVYNPIKTRMLKEAEAAGCITVDGLGMLLWQGAEAFYLYTGQKMPVREVQELFLNSSQTNL